MECGVIRIGNMDDENRRYQKIRGLLRYGYGVGWRESVGWNSRQMKRYYKCISFRLELIPPDTTNGRRRKNTFRDNLKPTEKLVGLRNERGGFPSKN